MVKVWTNPMNWHVNGGQKQQHKETKRPLEILKNWMQWKEKQHPLQHHPHHHFFVPPVAHPNQPTINLADVVDASRLAIAAQHAKENIGEKVGTKENVKKNAKNKKCQKQRNSPNKFKIIFLLRRTTLPTAIPDVRDVCDVAICCVYPLYSL